MVNGKTGIAEEHMVGWTHAEAILKYTEITCERSHVLGECKEKCREPKKNLPWFHSQIESLSEKIDSLHMK